MPFDWPDGDPVGPMTLAEFPSIPERKPWREYINGVAAYRPLGSMRRGEVKADLCVELGRYADDHPGVDALMSLTCIYPTEERVYISDFSVYVDVPRSAFGKRFPVDVLPQMAIDLVEYDAPEGWMDERIEFHRRVSTRLFWVVDGFADTVTAYRPGQEPEVAHAGQLIDAGPVLPGFTMDVAKIFGRPRRRRSKPDPKPV